MKNATDNTPEFPPIFDEAIREKLHALSLTELRNLSEASYTTADSGYLMAKSKTASKEDFILELCEVSDKAEWQIAKIKETLDL